MNALALKAHRRFGPDLLGRSQPASPARALAALGLAALLWVAPAPVRAASVESRQAGTATLAVGAASATVTLAKAVAPERAFLVFGASENANAPADGLVSGQITGAGSTLTFERQGSAGAVTVEWYVVEFVSGVAVQRGSTTITTATTDLTLSAVDLTKSFPLISYRAGGVNFNENDFVRARVVDPTTLRLSFNPANPAPPQVVEWQVVEYQDASVRTMDEVIPAGSATVTRSLSPAAGSGKAWLLFSYECAPAAEGGCPTTPAIGAKMVRGTLSDVAPTQLTFSRGNTTERLDLTWYLVEFTDGTIVQHGAAPLAGGSLTRDVTIAPTVLASTIATAAGHYMRGGQTAYASDDNPGVASFTLDLVDPTTLRITRGTTAGGTAAATVEWFTIRFELAGTAVELMSFEAEGEAGAVRLRWRTGSELDNLGFHLHRSTSEAGPWTRITASLIPGLGSSPVGASYSHLDGGLEAGRRYTYRLEDVDTASVSTFHGPVSAVAGTMSPLPPGEEDGGGEREPGAESAGRGSSGHCPEWVVSMLGASPGEPLFCTPHGDPDAVSLSVLSRDSHSAELELRTGGFWALHESPGTVRVFVPGFDTETEADAPALPLRRALVEAVVGRQVRLASVTGFELRSFADLRPSAVGSAEIRVSRDGTLRPARRAARAARASRSSTPAELARVAGTVFQGERKSAVVEVMPLRWDGERGGLVLARRVRVRLAFAGVEPAEKGSGGRGRRERRGVKAEQEVLAQLHTTRRGLHAVRFEAVFPERRRGLETSLLRLQREGEAVAFRVEPTPSTFGPGSVLFFHADRGARSTDFTSEVAYELVRSREGQAMAVLSAPPEGPPVPTSGGSASFEVNRVYQAGLLKARDVWLWEALTSGASRTTGFTLRGIDTGSALPGRVVVELQGGSESGRTVDHHVRVFVNGTYGGETRFAGKVPHRMEVEVPAPVLREGTNEVQLSNVGDTGVSSLVFLDRFSVEYPQRLEARSGVFEGVFGDGGTAAVGGLDGPVVAVDVTAAPQWVTGLRTEGGVARFRAESGRLYLLASAEGLLLPRVVRPAATTLRSTDNRADYLLIAPASFLVAAEPLIARRAGQGLVAKAVSLDEIATAFGHGQASGEAIRSFVSYAYHSWTKPSPRYVVLLGDATYDPQHFASTSWPSPLPALWGKTSYLWTALDPVIGAVNGEDDVPDLAVGRIPATTVEQAEALVGKLLAWEDSGQGLAGRVLLVADNPDGAGDFEWNVADIRTSFLADRETEVLKVGRLGAATRPAIQQALDEGLSLLSYVGHGGSAVWASENVWNSWDAPKLLAQSRQPVLLTLNCLNGYFVAAAFDSLSESLLKVEGRGAIAAVSPSGMSVDGPAHQYHRAVVRELMSGRHERLGDAVLAAQGLYAQTGLMPELLSIYHLLGDPATTIR